MCLIPEIFLHCVETKEYCKQNENWEIFLRRLGKFSTILENFLRMRAEQS